MELRQLRQFLCLVETRNFHRAAEQLNIAQPPLSVSIRKLELDLGVRLFERHSRGVSLTPEGELAAEQAREIVRMADELRQCAKETVTGVRGRLNVGFVASATYDLIPALVPVFRERFPAVELRLKEATSVDIVSGLLQGELDVGLVRTPIFGTSRIRIVPVASETMVLAVPRGHRFESRADVRLEELGEEPLIMWNREAEPWFQTLIDLSFAKVDIAPTVVEEASHVHTVLALVECGVGGALVPSVLRRSGTGRVRLVDITCQGEPISIGFAIAVRLDHPRRVATNFTKVATDVVSDPSWHSLLSPHSG